jgi:hypothetical protein
MSHLLLSRHEIWYYRRVYLTPRKCREIRISLRIRSKCQALLRVEKYLISQPFHCVPQSIPAHTSSAAVTCFQQPRQKKPFKSLISTAELKRGRLVNGKYLTINRCVNTYLNSSKEPFSKRSAAAFVDGLEGLASTRKRYIKKNSAFFKWLATRTDEDIRNHGEGRNYRTNGSPSCVYTQRSETLEHCFEWCKGLETLDHFHSQLLALGLLDFINDRKGYFFPELTLHLGSYGHYFSRWFTRFRGKHGLPE